MAPALPAGLIGREAAACVLLGAVLGGARALFPEKGRGAFLPDVLLVGALLLGLQSYAASLSFGGVLRWYQLAAAVFGAWAAERVLRGPVLGIASIALLSSKSLNLLLVLSLLTMKREIEKELANAIGQHHGQTLITKDALLMNMRPDSSYEFGRHTSLRCISIINNQTNRLVMMNSCAA